MTSPLADAIQAERTLLVASVATVLSDSARARRSTSWPNDVAERVLDAVLDVFNSPGPVDFQPLEAGALPAPKSARADWDAAQQVARLADGTPVVGAPIVDDAERLADAVRDYFGDDGSAPYVVVHGVHPVRVLMSEGVEQFGALGMLRMGLRATEQGRAE